jgi:DNA-binding transcriptional ArsR family regulator
MVKQISHAFFEPLRGKIMAAQVDKFEELARVFQSLGGETRLRIMTLLTSGETGVAVIYKKLKLPPATASHHLSLLREGGLVVSRREGRNIFYSIADLTKHRLGKKSESAKRGSNAAKFGPAELLFPRK